MQDRQFPHAKATTAEKDQLSQVMGANAQTALADNAASVLKNTYMLLGLTLAFSAFIAYVAMAINAPHPGLIITLVGFYGLLFGIHKTQNSGMGLVLTFALTGFMGYTIGPLLSMFIGAGAGHVVANALGLTAFVFFGLSAYALITRKDFSFLAGTITAGCFVLIGAMILGFFTNIAGLQLMISAGFVLFSSMVILYQTSEIIHGGETNYIMATVTLFVSIYNLFLSLLQLLMAFSGDD
jgi:modulator of FtsH protease